MGSMDGKVVVVTGAGRGLGRAYALALAAEGASVLVNDVGRELKKADTGHDSAKYPHGPGLADTPPDISVAQNVVDEIAAAGGTAIADQTDIASIDRAASVVHTAYEAFGAVHAVVNNAGTYIANNVDDLDDEALDKDFSSHVKGTAGTTKAAFEVFRKQGHGGSIVNTITTFGALPLGRDLVGYNAAKHAVVSHTLSAAAEGAEYGIRANAFCPTAITRQAGPYMVRHGYYNEGDADVETRLGPHKMAPLVVYLASDASRELNGRLFLFQPTNFGATPEFRLKETFVAETEGVTRASWTPADVARAMPDVLRKANREGSWLADPSTHIHRYDS